MLDVRRLRLLRELSLRGTIVAVADALAFTPSAVSQQLSALEREAGIALLERTGRRVVLTPAGLNLVEHAEAVLARLEQATAELADARQGLAGPLRIGTFPTAARAIVPAALTTLAAHHPGLEPMVSEIDPAGVAHALRAGELDVALVHDYDFVPSPAEPGLASEPLCAEYLCLAALSPETAETTEGASISRWRDAPWITATPGTLCHAMTLRACQAAGFTPRVRHQVDEFATVLALVAAGQGVALVPQLGVAEPVPGVTLTRLPVHRRTRIAFRRGADGHPAVAAITAALRTAVPEELRPGP
ncbi:LysR family transcriptional regulator [Streptomyces abyssalis]|uniref:LysR family transcriptional regulator n=1 Tax=Streptomyces abyssalis TaxID=933944 RepID=A0A1E7JR36_9ACTN|nr:LysR substrate-binding domain-containing protein [Streptomyces abyssalis]OEU90726.1 LysR family transcriptional regulator [Streptomyces abyssalis]OEU95345.1 LysR family transcriptional regulator [Streptomyces abyssalis]OEV29119.1 LysR family transcriptional regulator [Streptomyces nanshensis]